MSTTNTTESGIRTTGQAIDEAKAAGRTALIGYLSCGFPSVEKSVEAAKVLVENGFDIIELGLPYSDPGMDGPLIQHTGQVALDRGTRVDDVVRGVEQVAATGAATLVMTYWNPVYRHGVAEFSRRLAEAGGAGLITSDLPPEEAGEWIAAADEHGLDRVFLVAPSSRPERLERIARASRGFVYAASRLGVTGVQDSLDAGARPLVEATRAAGAERVCVGIGVSTGAQAAEVAQYADGVIVGSALIKTIVDEDRAWTDRLRDLAAKAEELATGVRGN